MICFCVLNHSEIEEESFESKLQRVIKLSKKNNVIKYYENLEILYKTKDEKLYNFALLLCKNFFIKDNLENLLAEQTKPMAKLIQSLFLHTVLFQFIDISKFGKQISDLIPDANSKNSNDKIEYIENEVEGIYKTKSYNIIYIL
ncbi:hypothetical protein GVAV_001704 [Gurleya vavrai]